MVKSICTRAAALALIMGSFLLFSSNAYVAATAEIAVAETNIALRLQPGGYQNETFDFDIEVTPDSQESRIALSTTFDRTLQYTLSTVEGRILSRGKMVREASMNVSRLREGSYVMYFFRGHRVVKAVLLDRV